MMDWCDVCKYNPPDYLSHEPDKPCGDCWVYGEGNEPTKFAETDNRQTNADRIRQMSDEELAFYIVNHPMWSDESACVAWLKSPEVDNGAKMDGEA